MFLVSQSKKGLKKERRPIANRQLLYQSSLLPPFLPHGAPLGDGMNSLDTKPDPMPGDSQELDVPNPANTPPLLQSTTENSAAENSVPATSLPPLLDDSQRTLSDYDDSLNLRRSSRTRRKTPYLTENYHL